MPAVHPIERLRYVARAGDVAATTLVSDAAAALAAFTDDRSELLTACRQLLRRRPGSGPLVWLAARMLTGVDPIREARDVVDAITADPTCARLAAAIPSDVRLLVVGSPDIVGRALSERPDVEVLVVDAAGDGYSLLRRLAELDHVCTDVPDWGVGAAVSACDLVLIEADAAGPDGLYARAGSRAAAAVAVESGVDVWAVVGVGGHLPELMWRAMLDVPIERETWLRDVEFVPLVGFESVCGRSGLVPVAEAVLNSDCPVAPELFR